VVDTTGTDERHSIGGIVGSDASGNNSPLFLETGLKQAPGFRELALVALQLLDEDGDVVSGELIVPDANFRPNGVDPWVGLSAKRHKGGGDGEDASMLGGEGGEGFVDDSACASDHHGSGFRGRLRGCLG
jgi:hypothetical protein